MSDRPGTFHQLTQQAERDLKDAANMLDELIAEQRRTPSNPQMVAWWTLECLGAMAKASQGVTTAAMQWAADQAEERE
jgi:hypothetical protein